MRPAAAESPPPLPTPFAIYAGLAREPALWSLVLAVWALCTVLVAPFFRADALSTGSSVRDAALRGIAMGGADAGSWVLTLLAGLGVAAVVPLDRRRWLPGALAVAAAVLLLPPLRYAAASELWVRLGWAGREPLLAAALLWLPAHYLLVAPSVGAGYGLLHAFRQRGGELALARREAELAHARFQSLRSRVSPDLLFSAFAAIGVLARCDPEGADRLLLRVSRVLRAAFGTDAGGDLALDEELEQVRLHAELAGGGAPVRVDATDEALGALIPRMALYPLVAGALRADGGGEVEVRARAGRGELRLEVRDRGALPLEGRRALPGWDETELVNRVLEDRFGPGRAWSFADLPSGGVAAVLSLPLSTPAPAGRP